MRALAIAFFLCALLTSYAAHSSNFFPAYELDHCRLIKLVKRGVWEFCASSEPVNDQTRRFRMTLRDPSRMERKVGGKAMLVSMVEVLTKPGEYLDYKAVLILPLVRGRHLVFAPIVNGVPGRYESGRAEFFIFDEESRKFQSFWLPASCQKPCQEQKAQLLAGPEEDQLSISYTAISAGQPRQLMKSIPAFEDRP
jgi:hypothetical protein